MNEEAIKILEEERMSLRRLAIDSNIPQLKPMYEAITMAIEALKAQEWTPCSEGFPEKRGVYFVTEQNFGGREEADMHEVVSHSSYYYGNDKWSDRFYSDDVSNITAWMPSPWMPSPEPYKAESEE